MRDVVNPPGAGSACTCLGNQRGDSPLCPYSREQGRARRCVHDDAQAIAGLQRVLRRLGFQQLRAGHKIDRTRYALEWYDLPGNEFESAVLELEVIEDLLLELQLQEIEAEESNNAA